MQNCERGGNMPELNDFYAGGELANLSASGMGAERAERLTAQYGGAALQAIFGNTELMSTCLCLLENDLNLSLTASKLYMHRNTLTYRINKIERECALNLRKFPDAVIFLLLYSYYSGGRKK